MKFVGQLFGDLYIFPIITALGKLLQDFIFMNWNSPSLGSLLLERLSRSEYQGHLGYRHARLYTPI